MASDPVERLLDDLDRPVAPRPAFAESLLERLLTELETEAPLVKVPQSEWDISQSPDVSLGQRLEGEKQQELEGPTMTPIVAPFAPSTAVDHRAWNRLIGSIQPPMSQVLKLASAALLVITLAVMALLWGWASFGDEGGRGPARPIAGGLAVPAAIASPEAVAPAMPSPSADDETLVALAIPAGSFDPKGLGDGRFSLGLVRAIMPANTTTSWPSSTRDGRGGLELHYILAGSVTIMSTGPVTLAQEGTTKQHGAETELALAAGDAVLLRVDLPTTWTTGTEPVTVLTGFVEPDAAWEVVVLPEWLVEDVEFDDNAGTTPVGTSVLRIQRHSMEPDDRLSPEPETALLAMLDAESSGFLAVGSDGAVTYKGANTGTVYVFTLDSTQDETAEDNDINGVQVEVAFHTTMLPAGPVNTRTTLYSVAPGVSVDYPVATLRPTAAILWVQSGMMAVGGEPITVHRGSATPPDATPSAGETLLGPGDAIALEFGTGRTYPIQSLGDEPLVFVEAWIVGGPLPAYGFPASYNVVTYANLADVTTLPADATVTVRLIRTVLEPGETHASSEGGWQTVLTENAMITRGATMGNPVQNVSDQPATLFVLTAEFLPVEATPTP